MNEYRDASYDIENLSRTTSWSDGIKDEQQFTPALPRPIRRTSSADDIERFKRHFVLAQSNQGKLFTWRHYLNILRDELRKFDTLVVMSKVLVQRLASPFNSEISTYITASDSDSAKKKTPLKSKLKKISFKRRNVGGDAESVSSMELNSSLSSNLSLTPQTTLLKKMCTEIRTLARKTCKTVEKMSAKSKYCSACGDYIGNVKIHKDCSQPFLGGIGYTKPLTPDIVKARNMLRMKSPKISDWTMKTPTTGGNLPVEQSSKIISAPSAVGRMKPFTKQSDKK